MRRFATHVLIAVVSLQTLAWGLCPCAMGKALRSLANATPGAEAPQPCCPRCRKTAAPEGPAKGRVDGATGDAPTREGPTGGDCPHCGALARGATSPTVSTPEALLPSVADVLAGEAVILWAPATSRPDAMAAPRTHGPPDARIETVVLRI